MIGTITCDLAVALHDHWRNNGRSRYILGRSQFDLGQCIDLLIIQNVTLLKYRNDWRLHRNNRFRLYNWRRDLSVNSSDRLRTDIATHCGLDLGDLVKLELQTIPHGLFADLSSAVTLDYPAHLALMM